MAIKNQIIIVEETKIAIVQSNGTDYISLTDMVRNMPNNNIIIGNWLRKKDTIEYLGIWEELYNPNFKLIEFDEFKKESGTNRFTLSPQQWIDKTKAVGIVSKSGRYGGTYAHKDIAFHFGIWISPKFQLLLIKEFQRLKEEENRHKHLEWDMQRTLAKINYRIHTDAIKENLIPDTLTNQQKSYVYADEADLINVALFGKTAKQWRNENPARKGNIRDIATLEQLVVLSNLESINSMLIKQGLSQPERLQRLNETAISQMRSLLLNPTVKKLTL
jgi:hypothetical protein